LKGPVSNADDGLKDLGADFPVKDVAELLAERVA